MGADLLEADPNGFTALHHIATQCLQKDAPNRRSRLTEGYKPEFYRAANDRGKSTSILAAALKLGTTKAILNSSLTLPALKRDFFRKTLQDSVVTSAL
jgi:hypothetical protein